MNLSGAKRAERLVEMPADSRKSERFDVSVLDAGGPIQGWVALSDPDPVRADNIRYFTVPRSRDLKYLIMSESNAPGDAAFFLARALEPPGLVGATGVSARVEAPANVTQAMLDESDVVVLADVSQVPERLWGPVERFAVGGKGLVIFLGERAESASYSRFLRLYFGAELGRTVRAARGKPSKLVILSYDHPMLNAFAGGRNGNLAAARFERWRKLEPSPGSQTAAGQLARMDDGSAALLAAPVGAGRAVVAAFAPSRTETDLPLRAPFVPFVHEVTRYAASLRGEYTVGSSGYELGEPIRFPVRLSGGSAEVSTPLERRQSKVELAPGATEFVYRAFFPGNYFLRLPTPEGTKEIGFSANIAASESRSERVSHETIAETLEGAVVARDLSAKPLRRVWGSTRGARELFDFFLVAAVAVLVLEEYIANRFYRETGAGGAR